ncbi:hypothetical protein [Gimesia sp.]|uniref:hypothetical protein n=1 Tax=Gimesia sp. TaxID=2024833 RepID=UPI000C620772|nr:hypothetical protein [Gimesia sp.]MAX40080.1 hypothetical protein [Gimesia sp.]HAH46559.1 hypothetical protein [Planctomycetaceae bacterium]|tara:strand:- start:3578 stop:3973 length:396 start_codon:yes stop_codon:yes gene_type:complete
MEFYFQQDIKVREKLEELIHSAYAGNLRPEQQEEFNKNLLLHGSHSEENIDAISRIEFASQKNDQITEFYFRLKKHHTELAEITNHLEGEPIPDYIHDAFPDLSQEDWDATFRYITLLLTLFGVRVRADGF